MTAERGPAWLVSLLKDHRKYIDSKPYYMQPGKTRMPKNFEAVYRCKCGHWTGVSAEFDDHLSLVLWAGFNAVQTSRAALSGATQNGDSK